MFQPQIRRVLASAALLSVLSLLPAQAAAPKSPRPQQTRSERNVVVRLADPVLDLAIRLLGKVGVRIDPNGSRLTVHVDPEGNVPSGNQGGNQGNQ